MKRLILILLAMTIPFQVMADEWMAVSPGQIAINFGEGAISYNKYTNRLVIGLGANGQCADTKKYNLNPNRYVIVNETPEVWSMECQNLDLLTSMEMYIAPKPNNIIGMFKTGKKIRFKILDKTYVIPAYGFNEAYKLLK
ncbi:MAG TPA: hypothetical protein ACHBX6_11510 [Arsenophonus nasoniae]|uniref:hypothetical protein n=1 Tax=Arsenophonus nasoniae TaxID=638 RepID=UPI003879A349